MDDTESERIASVDQLIAYFHEACRPASEWKVGTEHEIIGVSNRRDPGAPLRYDGDAGIRAVLEALAAQGWSPVYERDQLIALTHEGASVTIEPGGQFELSSRPVTTADETRDELQQFWQQLAGPSGDLGITWLGLGFRPFGTLDDVPWMPKRRYDIMREYLPTRGRLAHEMMKRTATVQTNLDFSSVEDARAKFRCVMSTTSILTALYANSPVTDGALNGYQSYRGAIWRETDPDRCGLLAFAWQDVDLFEAYTQWALDVPMFFIHRGDYIFADGLTFRRFLAEGFGGHRATMDDWVLHLSTLFPEARLKRYIEVRSCDSGGPEMVMALGPLCKGMLYSDTACSDATALTRSLDLDQRRELVLDVARRGLRARVPGKRYEVRDLAVELVAIADAALAPEERHYLEPLREIATTGRTRADVFIDIWKITGGDPRQILEGQAPAANPPHLLSF